MFKKVLNLKNRVVASLTILTANMLVMPVSCETIHIVDQSADNLFGNVLGIFLNFCQYIGAAVLLYGFFQLGMGLKNDDSESKSRATSVIASGVFLFSIKTLLKMGGIIA